MAKTVSCRDVGMDCDFVAKGETNEDIMRQAAEHVHVEVIDPLADVFPGLPSVEAPDDAAVLETEHEGVGVAAGVFPAIGDHPMIREHEHFRTLPQVLRRRQSFERVAGRDIRGHRRWPVRQIRTRPR